LVLPIEGYLSIKQEEEHIAYGRIAEASRGTRSGPKGLRIRTSTHDGRPGKACLSAMEYL